MREFINIVNEASNLNARQEKLKTEIVLGAKPVVYNASSVADENIYTMGDVERIGWMTKEYTHDASGEVDGWKRHYSGPKPIMVKTEGAAGLKQLNPHETLE